MTTTWNPSDKTANLNLTNGNLTATGGNTSNAGARGTTGKSSGKWMLQFTNVVMGQLDSLDYVGIGTLADTLALANGSQDQVILCANGSDFSGTGSAATSFNDFSASWSATSATVDLCVDLTAQLYWFRVNGGNWSGTSVPATNNNPATGVGGHTINATGTKYPYVRLTGTAATATLNPTPASVPAGFSPWDVSTPPTPVPPTIARAIIIG